MAAAMGVSVQDAAAALDTMTQHGASADQAATRLSQDLEHIVKPSAAAATELKKLSDTSGIDLTKDFSSAGLAAKGLYGVMGDVEQATGGNIDALARIMPEIRA